MPVIDASLRQNGGNYSIGGNSCRYIVVHYTGAPGSAKNTATWSHNDSHGSSYHYVLDGSGVVYKTLNDTDTAWAVGAWPGYHQLIGNAESISIEVCSSGADFTAAEISELRWLVQRLMKEHNIPAARVVRHWDCHTGHKLCPAPYCGNTANDAKWTQLHKQITGDEEPVKRSGYSAKLYRSNNTPMQQFEIKKNGSYVTIRNIGRNMYLDVKNGANADHIPVRVWEKSNGPAQLWKLIPVRGEYSLLYELEPKCAPGMRLDAINGGTSEKTGLQIHKDNNTAAQRWQFIDSGDGVYRIASSKSGLMIDAGPGVQPS